MARIYFVAATVDPPIAGRVKTTIRNLILRWLVLALGVTLATKLVSGVSCDDGGTLVTVVILLSVFNAILKPVLVLFTLPFIVLTLGLGLVVINACLFLLVDRLVEGFHVASFGDALLAALIVGTTNLILLSLTKKNQVPREKSPPPSSKRLNSQDVIDV